VDNSEFLITKLERGRHILACFMVTKGAWTLVFSKVENAQCYYFWPFLVLFSFEKSIWFEI